MILRGSDSCKNKATAPFMSYPDVVIACIEHKVSLEAFRAIEAALVKHDNNMKDYFGGWLITITANHSNYLVCDRANTQSVTVRKVVKLQLNYCNALVIKQWIYKYQPVRRKNADVHSSSLLIDVYALFSDVSLRRQASMTQAEKFPDPFCSRAMLICSIIWLGSGCCGLLFCGFCSSLTWGCPVFRCRWFVLSEVVFTLSWCRSINTIPASYLIIWRGLMVSTHVVICRW